MSIYENWIAFYTIAYKEVRRFLRIWVQTLLPSAITLMLYFLIFGSIIGSRIGSMGGHDYMVFVIPGLIMMSIINNSYSNVASSFFSGKFQRSIEELLVSPVPNWIILVGYLSGGIVRGFLVAFIVGALSLFFIDISIQNPFITFSAIFLTATIFALGGFINGILAKKFDDITIVPSFILTPLTYFGGVFYSIDVLPQTWKIISMFNPIVYQVSAFRHGVLGSGSDEQVGIAFVVMICLVLVLFGISWYLLKEGKGLKN